MFNFLKSKNKKEIRTFQKHIKNVLIRDDDILSLKQKENLDGIIGDLESLYRKPSPDNRNVLKAELSKIRSRYELVLPPKGLKILREYTEIFIVALTVAFGVRALFVQPFKIPTSSMQPTLFGIHYIKKNVVPDFPQPINFALYSTQRAKLKIERSGELEGAYPVETKFFFPWTPFNIGGIKYEMPGSPSKVAQYVFNNGSRKYFEAGETVCDGWLSQGDHLFVDRLSYHFSPPKRGDIVIFTTENIYNDASGEPLTDHGFYYVKRLVGMPGDMLKIDGNGLVKLKTAGTNRFRPITDFGKVFRKIFSKKGGYQGYWAVGRLMEGKTVKVPEGHYFMLGDNTSVSADGRYWGFVPRANIVGKPLFVFWPFSRRWGLPDSQPPINVPTTITESSIIPQMRLQ
ncbi:MAG: signal peptidase I [Victivallales bacterium]|nr:signal peptidase I [Victivallales bacterium]MCF7888717.1 signal peptidase I [Victivallales bacterium]